MGALFYSLAFLSTYRWSHFFLFFYVDSYFIESAKSQGNSGSQLFNCMCCSASCNSSCNYPHQSHHQEPVDGGGAVVDGGADVDGGAAVDGVVDALGHPSLAPIDDLTQSSTTIQNRNVIVYLSPLLKSGRRTYSRRQHRLQEICLRHNLRPRMSRQLAQNSWSMHYINCLSCFFLVSRS